MRAVLIDPFNQTIMALDVNPAVDQIRTIIGCECVDEFRLHAELFTYIDEFGMLKPRPIPAVRVRPYPGTVAGRMLVFGNPDSAGSLTPCPWTLEQVEKLVLAWGRYTTREQVRCESVDFDDGYYEAKAFGLHNVQEVVAISEGLIALYRLEPSSYVRGCCAGIQQAWYRLDRADHEHLRALWDAAKAHVVIVRDWWT